MIKIMRNIICLFILIMSFTGILLLKSSERAEAAILESNIDMPLYGNGTVKTSTLSLKVDDQTNVAKLYFTPGDASAVFNKDYGAYLYYSIDVLKNDGINVRYASYNKGNDLQSKLVTAIDGKQIGYGDILKLSLAEPQKQKVVNADKTIFYSLGSNFKDMYYLMTPGGFKPVNDAIMFRTYDNTNGSGDIAFQITSLFSNQSITGSMVSSSNDLYNNGFVGNMYPYLNANNKKFQSALTNSNAEYASLQKYSVTNDHKLSSVVSSATAQPQTSIQNFTNQIQNNPQNPHSNFSGGYGTIYRVYSADKDRVKIFYNNNFKSVSQSETYYEYTTNTTGALKELDFNKVIAKNVTIELGSDTSKQSVANFSTASNYPKLSSSFGGELKSDTLGSYDIPISINQPLTVNNNYLNSIVTSKVTVVDTTKPTGTVKSNLSVSINETLNLKNVFTNVNDNSGTENLTYSYVGNSLDSSTAGRQTVIIRITDSSGNYTDYNVPIEVIPGNFGILSSDTLNFGIIKAGVTTKNIVLGTNETVGISMEDQRGTKTGWRIQAKTSAFSPKSTTTGKAFTAGIKMPKGSVKSNGTTTTDLNTFDVTLNSSLQNVISAPSGKGMNSWTYTLGTTSNPVSLVNIPTTVYVGDYQATLTWSMINAPS